MIIAIWTIIIMLITGLAVWLDYRAYQNKSRFLLIILSGVLLIGFVAQPKWWPTDAGSYALITDGFEPDGFKHSLYDEVYSLRNKDKNIPGRKWLSSAAMITDEVPPGKRIDIFGFGLKEKLPMNYRWFDRLQNPGKGLILKDAPKQIKAGKRFEFSVMVQGAGEEDSLQVYKDGELWESQEVYSDSIIVFADHLNMQGPITYNFEWMNKDSLYNESLNIRAVQPGLLTFGILMYSPSFEINYLAEHFGERGHSIISRSRIGQGRFRFDAMNASLDHAESFMDNLPSMDVLILDSREYQVLSVSEKDQVKEAVQDGLDILLISPQVENSEQWAQVYSEIAGKEVAVQTINRLEERNWVPGLFEESENLVPPFSLLNIDFIEFPESADRIHQYLGNKVVSLKHQSGTGSITGQLFYQTYSLLLEGEKELYNRFWVNYLNRIITLESSQLETVPVIPRVNERVNIVIAQPTTLERVIVKPAFSTDSLRIPITQHSINPAILTASYWPERSGWHFVEYADQKKWFYVYGETWKHDASVKNYAYTKKQISEIDSAGRAPVENKNTNVPNWIWVIGFMLIQFFLWIERKLG